MNRLDARARLVFHYAREEADRLGHAVIESEHLLLGLLREGGTAAQVLNTSGLSLEAARHRVVELIGQFERSREAPPPAITALARRVMDLAGVEAGRYQSSFITTGHVLLGMIHAGDGVAMGLINQMAGGTKAVRRATLEALQLPPDPEETSETNPSTNLSGIVAAPADSVLAKLLGRPSESHTLTPTDSAPTPSPEATKPEAANQPLEPDPETAESLPDLTLKDIIARPEASEEDIPDSMLIDVAFDEVPPEEEVQANLQPEPVVKNNWHEIGKTIEIDREQQRAMGIIAPALEPKVVSVPEVVEPVLEEKIVGPVLEEKVIEPILEEKVIEPIQEEVKPVLEEKVIEPILEEKVIGPILEEQVVEPILEEQVVEPIQEKVEPILEEQVAAPIIPEPDIIAPMTIAALASLTPKVVGLQNPSKSTEEVVQPKPSEEVAAPELPPEKATSEIPIAEVVLMPEADAIQTTPVETKTGSVDDLLVTELLEETPDLEVAELDKPEVAELDKPEVAELDKPAAPILEPQKPVFKAPTWDVVTASSVTKRHIIALGGGGFSQEPDNKLLDQYILEVARTAREVAVPRVCFVSTACGDDRGYTARFYDAFKPLNCEPTHLPLFHPEDWSDELEDMILSADVLYFSGGSTKNALALWSAWQLEPVFQKAYEAGTVFTGISAGAICWFEQFTTDSVGRSLGIMNGLGWLPGSFTPHYDSEKFRKVILEKALRAQKIAPGFAADDGAALHFVNAEYIGAVASRPEAKAYHVTLGRNRLVESPLETTYLGS